MGIFPTQEKYSPNRSLNLLHPVKGAKCVKCLKHDNIIYVYANTVNLPKKLEYVLCGQVPSLGPDPESEMTT